MPRLLLSLMQENVWQPVISSSTSDVQDMVICYAVREPAEVKANLPFESSVTRHRYSEGYECQRVPLASFAGPRDVVKNFASVSI